MNIKYVSFAKCAKLDKAFENNQGMYDPNRDVIYIEASLRKSRKERTLRHEKCHRLIYKRELKSYFTPDQEEVFCDIWEILKTPNVNLTNLEAHLKKRIMNGYKWQNSKEKIVAAVLRECGVKPTQALICGLL